MPPTAQEAAAADPSPPPAHPSPSSPVATTHATALLPLHADCAAFAPARPWRALLAVGGYELDEAAGTRSGMVQLYNTRGHDLRPAGPAWTGPGVLDAAWRPAGPGSGDGGAATPTASTPTLALALADGSVALLGVAGGGEGASCEGWLEEDDETGAPPPPAALSLSPLGAPLAVVAGGPLALALAWRDATTLAASTSAGDLAVITVGEGGDLALAGEPWRAHSLEAWCVAWGEGGGGGGGDGAASPTTPASSALLFSGADDAAFKGWDVRAGPATAPALAFTDTRTHGAGVTSIAPRPGSGGQVIATGSYDEQARLWDARSPGRPLLVSTLPTGGGVWRLRWHPADAGLLLAASMHAGFSILRVEEEGGGGGEDGGGLGLSLAVAERYPHQATLAYGADWCAAPPPRARLGAALAATASFYDNLVHLWEPATVVGGAGGRL